MNLRATLALMALALTVSPVAATAAERIALLLGNSDYQKPELDLANPVNDVHALAEALQRNGFEVIEATDLDADAMRATGCSSGATTC